MKSPPSHYCLARCLDDVVVTVDTLHTQGDTVRFLVTQKGANYLLVVKDNQPTLHRQLQRRCRSRPFSPQRTRSPNSMAELNGAP